MIVMSGPLMSFITELVGLIAGFEFKVLGTAPKRSPEGATRKLRPSRSWLNLEFGGTLSIFNRIFKFMGFCWFRVEGYSL